MARQKNPLTERATIRTGRASLKQTPKQWLIDASAQHALDVQRGCLCKAPTISGSMKFAPRHEACSLHGER